jgi:hypothetical protein
MNMLAMAKIMLSPMDSFGSSFPTLSLSSGLFNHACAAK